MRPKEIILKAFEEANRKNPGGSLWRSMWSIKVLEAHSENFERCPEDV